MIQISFIKIVKLKIKLIQFMGNACHISKLAKPVLTVKLMSQVRSNFCQNYSDLFFNSNKRVIMHSYDSHLTSEFDVWNRRKGGIKHGAFLSLPPRWYHASPPSRTLTSSFCCVFMAVSIRIDTSFSKSQTI